MVCRAFSLSFRMLAVAIVLGCGYWVFMLWSTGKLTAGAGSAAGSGLSWSLAALALMAYTLWCILTSVTTLTNSTLEQTFVWNKKLDLHELAYVKLIRVPGLDWLIAPRLYCRTLLGKFAVFYTSDVKMVAEFERLRDELSAFRKIR
jgi:ABC-type multidrug transport system fused ATPase/permease subunit